MTSAMFPLSGISITTFEEPTKQGRAIVKGNGYNTQVKNSLGLPSPRAMVNPIWKCQKWMGVSEFMTINSLTLSHFSIFYIFLKKIKIARENA